VIQHEKAQARIQHECLRFDDKPLFEFNIQADAGTVQLYHDDHSCGPELIVHINPATMDSESRQEESRPLWDMSNFAAWFRYLSQDQATIFYFTRE